MRTSPGLAGCHIVMWQVTNVWRTLLPLACTRLYPLFKLLTLHLCPLPSPIHFTLNMKAAWSSEMLVSLHHYTRSQPTSSQLSSSLPWKPHVLHVNHSLWYNNTKTTTA